MIGQEGPGECGLSSSYLTLLPAFFHGKMLVGHREHSVV
jgi:hypothetical protein